MTVILVVFLAAWLVMAAAPPTPIARQLHRWLVEAPAARLARVRPSQILLATLFALAIAAALWLRSGDGLGVFAMAAPDAVAALTSLEISAYLDIAIAAVVAWSAVRLRGGWSPIRPTLGMRSRRRPRARATRHRTGRPPADNDAHPDRRAA